MAYSEDLRRRVIKFVKQGGRQTEAVHLFGVDRKTIFNWLHNRTSLKANTAPRRRKLDKAAVLAYVHQRPDARQHDCAAAFGVTHVAVHKAFRRWGIRKKNDPLQGKDVYTTDGVSPDPARRYQKIR